MAKGRKVQRGRILSQGTVFTHHESKLNWTNEETQRLTDRSVSLHTRERSYNQHQSHPQVIQCPFNRSVLPFSVTSTHPGVSSQSSRGGGRGHQEQGSKERVIWFARSLSCLQNHSTHSFTQYIRWRTTQDQRGQGCVCAAPRVSWGLSQISVPPMAPPPVPAG